MRPTHRLAGVLALACLLAAPAAARAQEGPTAPAGEGDAAPAVDLESLLKLPKGVDVGVERRGNASESEWRSRFAEARAELAAAERALAESQEALEQASGGSEAWTLSPPGLNIEGSGNPEIHQLRQDIKRQRGEVERAQSRIRDLEIEANLADVPQAWRGPAEGDAGDAEPARAARRGVDAGTPDR